MRSGQGPFFSLEQVRGFLFQPCINFIVSFNGRFSRGHGARPFAECDVSAHLAIVLAGQVLSGLVAYEAAGLAFLCHDPGLSFRFQVCAIRRCRYAKPRQEHRYDCCPTIRASSAISSRLNRKPQSGSFFWPFILKLSGRGVHTLSSATTATTSVASIPSPLRLEKPSRGPIQSTVKTNKRLSFSNRRAAPCCAFVGLEVLSESCGKQRLPIFRVGSARR